MVSMCIYFFVHISFFCFLFIIWNESNVNTKEYMLDLILIELLLLLVISYLRLF